MTSPPKTVVRCLVVASALLAAAAGAHAPAARAEDAEPAAAERAPLLDVRPKVGDTFRFRYCRTEKSTLAGETKSWEQSHEIVESAAKGQDFGPIGGPMKLFDEKDFIGMATEGFVSCLSGEHAVGSAWTVNSTRKLGSLPTGFDETFTLRSADATRATVEETYAYDPAPGAMEGLRASGSGRSVWNRTDGLAESVTREWKTTGRGKYTVDGSRTETLERIPTPGPAPGTPPKRPPTSAPKGK
ncbi:MAG: hypothetical protein K8T90_02580 [Planctomycetes bacterium]|nr:hypothetical protein [Planctomycetota bacterium]